MGRFYSVRGSAGRLEHLLPELITVLTNLLPPGGRVVMTLWARPSELSEDEQEQVHEHLIERHEAMGIFSLGIRTNETPAEEPQMGEGPLINTASPDRQS